MTDKINDGGFAFPDPVAVSPSGDVYPSSSSGMTLRDWFAGQALGQAINHIPASFYGPIDWADGEAVYKIQLKLHAEYAYAQADAMLKARGETE